VPIGGPIREEYDGEAQRGEATGRVSRNAVIQNRSLAHKIVVLVPREGNMRNHRHEEPLFVLSMVA